MRAALQNRISPPKAPTSATEFSDAKVDDNLEKVNGVENRTDFKTLIQNSNEEVRKEREAIENGDLSAESEEDFLKRLAEQTKEKKEAKNELKKDDFLKLFVAQLQHQDPLNPDDGAEMATKLAQFNSLEQMMNVNTNLEKMQKSNSTGRNMQLVNYVGKSIKMDGGVISKSKNETNDIELKLKIPSTKTNVEIRNSAGALVFNKELGARGAGTHLIEWDGKNKTGKELPDGKYTVSINAKNINNDPIPVDLQTTAKVTGINIKSEDGGLYTNMGEIGFDQISSVGSGNFKQSISKLNRIQLESKSKATQSTIEDLQKLSLSNKQKNNSNKLKTSAQTPMTTRSKPSNEVSITESVKPKTATN